MSKEDNQTLKTPPAISDASRRGSAASEARRRSSSASRRVGMPGMADPGNSFGQFENLGGFDYNDPANFLQNPDDNGTMGMFVSGNDLNTDQDYSTYGYGANEFDFEDFMNAQQRQQVSPNISGALKPAGSSPVPTANLQVIAPRNSLVSLPSQFVNPQQTHIYPAPQPHVPQAYYNSAQYWQQQQQQSAYNPAFFNIAQQLNSPFLEDDSTHSYPKTPRPSHDDAQAQAYTSSKRRRDHDSIDLVSPEPQAKRIRSSRGSSHHSQYSAHSSRSTHSSRSYSSAGTDSTTRRRLRKTRKSTNIQRPSAIKVHGVGQKPQVRDDKAWVRTNATTRGLTSRTSKINEFDPSAQYEQRTHPLKGKWEHRKGYTFRNTPAGELTEKTYTAKQIENFILDYPENKQTGAHLILWIQKSPTDSARRYASPSHSKCLFKECLAHQYQSGTILHGHYRVALDEMSYAYGENIDPFMVAGYVHLYCLERYLDFPRICRRVEVQVDTRNLRKEPKGRFAATLAGQVEADVAQRFVDLATDRQKDQGGNYVLWEQYDDNQFRNYPRHKDYHGGESKPYRSTLAYHMSALKKQHRPAAQRKQFEDRGLKKTHLFVNMGDLEVLFTSNEKAKQKRKAEAKQRKKARKRAAESDDEDTDADESVQQSPPHKKRRRLPWRQTDTYEEPRQTIELTKDGDIAEEEPFLHDESESEDGDASGPPVQHAGSRSSARLRQKARPNYKLDDYNFGQPAAHRRGDPHAMSSSHDFGSRRDQPVTNEQSNLSPITSVSITPSHFGDAKLPSTVYKDARPLTQTITHAYGNINYDEPVSQLLPALNDPPSYSAQQQSGQSNTVTGNAAQSSDQENETPFPIDPALENNLPDLDEELGPLEADDDEMKALRNDASWFLRRQSSISTNAKRASRGASLLKSATSNRHRLGQGLSEGRKVSIGGFITHVFDKNSALSPRTARTGGPNVDRVSKNRTPSKGKK